MTSVGGPAWRSGASCLRAVHRCAVRPLAVDGCRHYAKVPSRKRLAHEMDKAHRLASQNMTHDQSVSGMQKTANAQIFKAGDGPLFPSTFIALPLAQCPREPSKFVLYQWNRMKLWLAEVVSILSFKLSSMKNWTAWPKWQARRGKIAPTAKVMYREMLEAFAAGDKVTLQNICQNELGKKLVAAIDRRDPRQSVRFQLVKYNKPLFYPRLVAHQIQHYNPFDKDMMTEQAVVAIFSTQQASRHNAATGETIPGSVKLQDKIEYVVLSRQISQNTFQSGPWRIWGTTSPTTLEEHLKERAAIESEQAKRLGWEQSSTTRQVSHGSRAERGR